MNAKFELIDTGTITWLVRRDDNGHIREIREAGRPIRLQSGERPDHSVLPSSLLEPR